MTTLPSLSAAPACAAALGMPSSSTSGGAAAGVGGLGAFAGLLLPDVALRPDVAPRPDATPRPDAAEPGTAALPMAARPVAAQPVAAWPAAARPGEAPEGDASEPTAPQPVLALSEAAAPATSEPSAAQIIAAAQVVPVGPMLTNAPRFPATCADSAPSPHGSTPGAGPAPEPVLAVAPGVSAAPPIVDGTLHQTPVFMDQTPAMDGPLAPGAPAVVVQPLALQMSAFEGAAVATPAVAPTAATAAVVEGPQAPLPADTAVDSTAPRSVAADHPTREGPAHDSPAPRGPVPAGPPLGPGQQAGQAGNPPGDRHGRRVGTRSELPALGQTGAQPTAAQAGAVAGLTNAGQVSHSEAPGGRTTPIPVAGQVFPEITRLVSRGDGTRRITLQLSPEALGDVRVILTVRNGEVQVRMSGGEQAQQALLAGAPELHRLLDLAGATSSQIQVGNQSSTHLLDQAGEQSMDQHNPQHGTRDDRDLQQSHPDHRTAGTRDGDTSARDGAPRGTHPRTPNNPGTRTRIAGVDVTM